MKRLSIIIVNYNVRHFLEQCLISVQRALTGIDAEVFVVDNNSVDGSQQMVKEKFGDWVKLIKNKDNPGFSKANNQAIRLAEGEYVLLLNPDTVVEESTFERCITFMDDHPDAGGLGVKMIDGKGKFLPESKRGLPTPWTAFYKIFGLSRLFPRSKKFGRYHLGFLSKDEDHEVEVLSGAFMMMRKKALDDIGLLDEDFFMYGEDIDLSYRIIKGGWKNYYFSGTQIIHYKGESTKKGSLNYVRVFYNAMIIFARKHFSSGRAKTYISLIRFAVYFRAILAAGSRVFQRIAFPLVEAFMVFGATIGVKEYWEYMHKMPRDDIPYPNEFDYIAAPIYAVVLIAFLWIAGGYKKPYKLKPIQTAAISGFIAIATVSYIFPDINFSRMIVGLSSMAMALIAMLNRNILNYRRTGNFFFTEESKNRAVIVGDPSEGQRIKDLIRRELDYPVEVVGVVRPDNDRSAEEGLGTLDQLGEIVRFYGVDEVVFANESLGTERIIGMMMGLQNPNIRYKIVPPNADYLVGPQVIHASRFSQPALFALDRRDVRFRKRLFDVVSSGALMLFFPLYFWLYRKPGRAFANLWRVFLGKYHLVGYIEPDPPGLPRLKRGVLNISCRAPRGSRISGTQSVGLDRHYASIYSLELDFEILMKGFGRLDG